MQDKNEGSPEVPAKDELLGIWRLTSAYVVIQETGERGSLYGEDPRGRLIFHPTARMMVLITAGQPSAGTDPAVTPPAHFVIAYSGTFSADAETFTTTVDLASIPGWVGTAQVRFYTLSSGKLSIHTPPGGHPAYPGKNIVGYLEWIKDDQSPRDGLD